MGTGAEDPGQSRDSVGEAALPVAGPSRGAEPEGTRALRRFRKNKGAVIGLAIVGSIVVFSLLGPLIAPYDPNVPNFEDGRGRFGAPVGPSASHWLGTDTIFRDVFARLAQGGRLSLEVALAATAIAMCIGTSVGILSGYYKGTRARVDHVLEGVALGNGAIGASMLAFGHPTAGWRLIGFAALAIFASLTLRCAGRLVTIARGRARALMPLDLIDSALFVAVFATFAMRRGDALGDHRFASALVLADVVVLSLRSARTRSSERYASRPIALLRVDIDDVLMRAVDVLLSFPFLLLLMAIAAAVDRTSLSTIFLVLGLTAWTGTARVIRSKTLQVRELDYVVASRALGQSTFAILWRHVLPNVAAVAIVLATNSVAAMIVAEAALSFLGLSVPPPAASWGRMLDDGREYYSAAPWLILAPAIAILLAVLGFNLLGEGLRDAFDPKDA